MSQSTISRELQRNIGLKDYRYKQDQNLSKNRRLSTVQAYKMEPRTHIRLATRKRSGVNQPRQYLSVYLERHEIRWSAIP
ncbi:MAG: IS30 family transposase [Gammaproteobacteria bacterium]